MRPYEFWTYDDTILTQDCVDITIYREKENFMVQFREVSTEREAAIKKMVEACEEQAKIEKHFQDHGGIPEAYSQRATKALEAWRKANE